MQFGLTAPLSMFANSSQQDFTCKEVTNTIMMKFYFLGFKPKRSETCVTQYTKLISVQIQLNSNLFNRTTCFSPGQVILRFTNSFKNILRLKTICCSDMMTFSTLGMGRIHQVSHEFLFLKIILWNDLQDLQISHTWNFSAGGLLRQCPRPSVANTVRAQGMNYRGLCKN